MNRIILYLVMCKHGLKKYERFQFSNQKKDAVYYFGRGKLYKTMNGRIYKSNVSLNWLLDPACRIVKV